VGFVDPTFPHEANLIGAHGSLTAAEMLVPLLATRGRGSGIPARSERAVVVPTPSLHLRHGRTVAPGARHPDPGYLRLACEPW
jgi:hypothetical protein